MVAAQVAEQQYEVLHVVQRGGEASISRARRIRDGQTVLLKVRHTARGIERLRRELDIARSLDPNVALRPVELITIGGSPALVLDDFSGVPLATLLAAPIELGAALEIASALVASLAGVHRGGIVHRDLKPRNILFDPRTGVAKLTGFGIALTLPGEHWTPAGLVDGTPPYVSPEQTGRLSRPIDARSDLYTVGVILYELFTGTLPFEARDVPGWVHCHIARVPTPPVVVDPRVPRPVSELVMKLLAKLPDERYQTATGLLADLRRCRAEWNEGRAVSPFELGSDDFSDRLLVPKKLYGREAESELLARTLRRVAAFGTPGLVLVAGPAGAGKSALARSIEEPVARMRGIFVTGGFEEHEPRRPYCAIATALKDVVPYILAEGRKGLGAWRARLADALGPIGQLVVELVPSLVAVVGKQPPVPGLPLAEAQDRFFLVLRRFVAALASSSQVLVLALDDLQRADVASLSLVEHLLTHPETGPLLVIGTYRDDAVAPDHPLRAFGRKLRSRDTTFEEISLAPLTIEDVTELCADALSSSVEQIAPLARIVWDKTGGNGLGVTQLLPELHRDGLLVFDAEDHTWRWDLARVGDVSLHGDVVERMLTRLHELDPLSREALEVGACIGPRFDARTLALVTGAGGDETHRTLDDAVAAGLLSSVGDTYRFLHDRIHEAVYAGIPERQRAELHARIGRLLLERLAPEQLARRVFDVAGQLNLGASVLSDRQERHRAAELDLQAGRAAAAASGYAAAASYLAMGALLLDATGWRERYELAFSLHLERARCELAQGHFDEAQRLIGVLRQHARAAVVRDRAVDRLQMEVLLFQNDVVGAVTIAIEVLEGLGVDLSPHPASEDLAAAERAVWRELAGRSIDELVTLPDLADAEVEAALELLAALLPPAYFTNHRLHCLVACRMVALSMRHGVTGASAMGFAAFAMELISTFGRPEDGRRFGELALRLTRRHGYLAYAAQTLTAVAAFVAARTGPLGGALDLLRAAHKAALDVGDLAYAGYCCAQIVGLRIARGDPLDDVEREARALYEVADRTGFRAVAGSLRIYLGFIENLQGRTRSASTFTGSDPGGEELLRGAQLPVVAVWLHIRKLQALCIHLDHTGALEHAERARPLLWATTGQIQVAEYHFYAALAHAALARAATTTEDSGRTAHGVELARHAASLETWADACPESFLYMRALVSAERARLEGGIREAMQLYEQAIHSAHDNGFPQGEALAYEHAASFYAELGLPAFADLYLREARGRYLEWGAHRKVRALDERLPHLARAASSLPPAARASQVISSELVWSRLLATLTQVFLEQAGARRAVFLSIRGEQWVVESVAGPEGGVFESIVNHVLHTREPVRLDDATLPGPYSADPYVARFRPRSVLCLPIVRHANLIGIVYLDNELVPGAFTRDTQAVLELLVEQSGISLEDARLYADRGREIAERQQAEATLRSVLDNMVDAVCICDRSARITLVNPAGARLLSIQGTEHPLVEEFVRRLHATHPDGSPFAIDELPLLRALAGEVVSSVDLTLRDPRSERATHLRVSAAPLQDEKGAIAGAVAVAVNVTEATELNLIKEQFVRVVAHELKTPITIVKGYADVLRRTGTVPEAQRLLLDALIRGADRIDRLVTDLLTLWQLQTGRLMLAIEDRVDLVELAEVVVRRLGPVAARRVSVRAARPPVVAADRQLLEKVLSNLVDNAIRYSPGGGQVEIEMGIRDEQAVVSVKDRGVGIPKDKQPRLFEPFFRAHADTPYDFAGLGLGLYVTRAVVHLHGGSISAESEEGTGSTFRFTLPLRHPQEPVRADRNGSW